MAEVSREDIQKARDKIRCDVSPAFWAKAYKLQLPDGPFTFKDHEYLIDVFEDKARVQVNQKATQGGSSITEVLVNIHGCIKNRYPAGVAIAMPTVDDVQKFSKTKWDPIIQNNYHAIGRYVGKGKKDSDSASLKKIGNSHIHFIGTTLSRNIGGELESSTLRSFSCDKIVCDELDMMNQSVIEKLRGRYAHSKIQEERFISNPTGENYGINALFQLSDQKYWNRLCPHCLKWTSAELEFLKNPEGIIRRVTDSSGYLVCAHCKVGPLPLYYFDKKTKKKAMWIPLYPGREISGRLWGQLNSAFHDPVTILNAYLNPPEGNFKDVMRYRLGFAHTSKEDQLRPSDVYDCCSQDGFMMSSPGPCVMGVDVGIVKHIVIGEKIGKDKYRLIYTGTRRTWGEIHDLAQKYNIRSAGIDIAPDIDAAKQFQKNERYQVWLCDYKTSKNVSTWQYDTVNHIAKINRTEVLDTTHRLFIDHGIIIPRKEAIGEEFVRQICDPFKIESKNERTGIPEYRYQGSNDHFRHALNYFVIAAQKAPRVQKKGFKLQTMCINE